MTDLPAGWEMRRLKTVARLRTSNVDKKKVDGEVPVRLCNYTDVYYSETIASADGFMEATATPEEIARFQLRKGDVLVTKDSESRDDIAVPAYVARDLPAVLCGYHLALLRPRREVVDGRFLHYCFLEGRVAHQFTVGANGITRFGLSQDVLNDARLPVPPLSTQRAVASFLDRETEKIDTLIEKKRRLLELLEEKRTALITRAVTKGLDPDVPMKDSGVEWLGEIPEHWEVRELRHLCPPSRPIIYGIVLPGPSVEDGVPLIKGGNVERGELDPSYLDRVASDIEAGHARSRVMVGDVVYSIRGSFGRAAMVPPETDGANLTQDAARVSPREEIDGAWLRFALVSPPLRATAEAGAVGATIRGVNIRDLRRLRIPTPPRPEMRRISKALRESSSEIDRTKGAVVRAIGLLQEYRTALISAAVTGKMDVTTESAA